MFVLTHIAIVNTAIDNIYYRFIAAGDWSAIIAA